MAWIDATLYIGAHARIRHLAHTRDGVLLVSSEPTVTAPDPMTLAWVPGASHPVGTRRGITAWGSNDGLLLANSPDESDDLIPGLRHMTAPGCRSAAVTPDGARAAIGGHQTVEVWDIRRGVRLWRMEDNGAGNDTVAFSPDRRLLATGCRSQLLLLDAASGAVVSRLTDLQRPLRSVAFSPDGRFVAGGIDQRHVGLWNVPDLTTANRFPIGGYQHTVAFSPDGVVLATAGQDEVVHLWTDPHSSQGHSETLHGPVGWIDALAFSPDGQTLAAASRARIHLWHRSPTQTTPPQPPTRAPLLVANAQHARPLHPRPTTEEFLIQAADLPWFERIGTASPWDAGCVRIADWREWPGPQDEAIAIHDAMYAWSEAVQLVARTFNRSDLTELFTRTERIILAEARRNVPYDDEADTYHPPTACVYDAAHLAATIACYLELGWPIPPDLEEEWAWFAAGHWPCGYAYDTGPDQPPFLLYVL